MRIFLSYMLLSIILGIALRHKPMSYTISALMGLTLLVAAGYFFWGQL
ncbi:MAG: hypothetical protein MUD01_00170 [Chloroflexaceae bacterium]|jgi:hypothetical protein|nr:hypothetical protein [Chloroflexaceae bacterium]